MEKIPLFFFLIGIILLGAIGSAAELHAGTVTLSGLGQTEKVPISLDQTTNGLAGYTLEISLSNPSVAQIIAIEYPAWVSLSDTTALPADQVRLKAVDLNRQIQGGATDVPIATVTIMSQSAGSAILEISPVRVDDDTGNGINPPAIQRSLIVTVPGGGTSDGSGSGAYTSSGSSTDQTQTTNQVIPSGETQLSPNEPENMVTPHEELTTSTETGKVLPSANAHTGSILERVKGGIPIILLGGAVIVLLMFAVVRRRVSLHRTDQIPLPISSDLGDQIIPHPEIKEDEGRRAIAGIIAILNDIDGQLASLDRTFSERESTAQLSREEASVIVERFFLSCQKAEEMIKQAAGKGQISKIQVYDLNGQLSEAVKRMISLSRRSETLTLQMQQYGVEVEG
jgi:hypothetical protein